MLISIIIPMYNAEKFISCCLNSVLDQNLKSNEYEIIVINDGSTDKGPSIVYDYTNKHQNISLYNQLNEGNGQARNTGLKKAKGKYLYFLDSDDYIAKGVLKDLLNILEVLKLDILGFNTKHTTSSNDKISENFYAKIKNLEKTPIEGEIFIGNHNYRAEVWWYIIKRKYLKTTGIEFYKRKFVQDSYITPNLLINANRVLYLPLDIHRYRKHETSITNLKKPEHIKKHINDMFFAIEKLNLLIEPISNVKAKKRLISRQQSYFFFLILRFIKSNMKIKDFKIILKKAKTLNVYPMKNFLGKDYNGSKYYFLIYIFNHKLLLIPFVFINQLLYRFYIKYIY